MKWANVLFASVCTMIAAPPARAQMPGDWNGDGLVSYADVNGLDGCLLGPLTAASSACAGALDLNGDGRVSLIDALQQGDQAQPTTTDNCSAWGEESWRGKGFFGYILPYVTTSGGAIFGAATTLEPRTFNPFLCRQSVSGETAYTKTGAFVDIRFESDEDIHPDGLTGLRRELFWVQVGFARGRNWTVNHLDFYQGDQEVVNAYYESFDAYRQFPLQGPFWFPPGVVPTDRAITFQVRRQTPFGTIFQMEAMWLNDFGQTDQAVQTTTVPSVTGANSANVAHWLVETDHTENHASASGIPVDYQFCTWAPGNLFSFLPADLTGAPKIHPKDAWVTVSEPSGFDGDSFQVIDIRPQ